MNNKHKEQSDSPWRSPIESSELAPNADMETSEKKYGGIKRGVFVVNSFAAWFFTSIPGLLARPAMGFGGPALFMGVTVLFMALFARERMKNMGRDPRLGWLMLVPVVNIWILAMCLLCQEGHADTRKLDLSGKIVGILLIALIVFVVAKTVYGMLYI